VSMIRRIPFMILIAVSTSACSAGRAHWDATQLRDRAVDYYSDQIMDNLIRGRNGELILHANITSLNAVVGAKAGGSVGGGDSNTSVNERDALGVLVKTSKTLVDPFNISFSPEVSNSLTFTAVPEVNDPPIYEIYVKFLNVRDPSEKLSEKSGSLLDISEPEAIQTVRKSVKKPGEGTYVHDTLTKRRDGYYFVPSAYRQAYFDLCLGLIGRILHGARPEASAAAGAPKAAGPDRLPPKYDSQEIRALQRLQQQLDSMQ
jgi:hypothetical protein